jgi:hypothetical protein
MNLKLQNAQNARLASRWFALKKLLNSDKLGKLTKFNSYPKKISVNAFVYLSLPAIF